MSPSISIPSFFREYGLGMQSTQELFYDKENSLYNIPVEYSESGVYPGKDTVKGNLVIKIIMLSRLIVTTPQKNSYRYGEALDYTGIAVTAVYTDGSTEDVTSSAAFNPANGTVVTKDTANTVSVSYSNRWTGSAEGSFSFSILTLQNELQISTPDKTAYHKGERIDYTGVTVNAVYSDGSTEDITSSATFSPAEGTVISDNTTASVSFSNRWDESASGSFSLSIITLNQELQITPPDKTSYNIGEAIDYAGAAITAVYSDESTEDVTSSATFSPENDTVITEDMNGNVSVSYTDQWNENASGSFPLNVLTLQSELQIIPPEKTSYRQGEAIDYTGATVTAVYSDGSTEDVTSSATFSPANGTVITENMTGSVSVSYTNEWSENASGSLSLSIE